MKVILKINLESKVENITPEYIICKDFIIYQQDKHLIDKFEKCEEFEDVISNYWS